MIKNKISEQTAFLTQRVFLLCEKARRENLASLMNEVDINKAKQRDIFEYGLQLCAAGGEKEKLESILSNLIETKQDKNEKRFCVIQKEAVMHIQKGRHPRLFLWIILSLLNNDEFEELKTILYGSKIRDEINSIFEKQDKNEVIAQAPIELSDISSRPFSVITSADSDQLSQLLKNEKPELIAYILASVEPKIAAAVLCGLSLDLQSDIGYRIAVMDLPNIELLYDLLRLEKKFLSLCGKNYAPLQACVFEKVLKTYILREHAVSEAKNLYEKSSKAAAGKDEAAQITNDLLKLIQGCPVDFIKTNPYAFLNLLKIEHPKVIALTLCYIEPKKAALILSNLPEHLQKDTADRIILMNETIHIDNIAIEGGIKKLTELSFLAESQTANTIIEYIYEKYPELKEAIDECLFSFDDIVMLDERAVCRVLMNTSSGDLTKALYSADVKTREHIFKSMSKRAVVMLKEDIDCMTTVSAEESAQAQKKIVSHVRHLEERGEIILANYGADELVE